MHDASFYDILNGSLQWIMDQWIITIDLIKMDKITEVLYLKLIETRVSHLDSPGFEICQEEKKYETLLNLRLWGCIGPLAIKQVTNGTRG